MGTRHDPVVTFPDVEKLAIAYLKTQKASRSDMATWQFGTQLTGEALPFVLLNRIGGTRPLELVLDNARLDLEVRAKTREEGHSVIQLALALLLVMGNETHPGATIYRVGTEVSPFYLPDPVSEQPRWLATIHIVNRPAL